MKIRMYHDSDRDAALRIWREVGWIEGDFPKEQAVVDFWNAGRAVVAEIDGEAEALATTMPGDLRLEKTDLSFTGVTGVTTGRIARRSGAGGAVTARALAEDAENGTAVAGLSMFEQGYYERLGFGTGSYEHFVSLDPAALQVEAGNRIPCRLDPEDVAAVHAARCARHRPYGSINLHCQEITGLAIAESKNGFGLGFQENGELSHLFWASAKKESGPYLITFMAYRSWEQFAELLGLLRRLSDQVHLVKMMEPAGFHLQGLIEKPFSRENTTSGGKYENTIRAEAFWQLRILDLGQCVAAFSFPRTAPLRFSLELDDPIRRHLQEHRGWRGIGGEYTVTLGPDCSASPGADPSLPRLKAGVGAFSRLLFGVLPARALAVSDRLSGPPGLLRSLDETIRLPAPHFDWLF
jgi:hypothetical protein